MLCFNIKMSQNPDLSPVTDMDYSKLTPPPVQTRSSTDRCHCFLCAKGRQTLVPQAPYSNPLAPIKICPECKGKVAPGVSHVCTRTERNSNIMEMFRSLSDRSRGQVLSQSLKGKICSLFFVWVEHSSHLGQQFIAKLALP